MPKKNSDPMHYTEFAHNQEDIEYIRKCKLRHQPNGRYRDQEPEEPEESEEDDLDYEAEKRSYNIKKANKTAKDMFEGPRLRNVPRPVPKPSQGGLYKRPSKSSQDSGAIENSPKGPEIPRVRNTTTEKSTQDHPPIKSTRNKTLVSVTSGTTEVRAQSQPSEKSTRNRTLEKSFKVKEFVSVTNGPTEKSTQDQPLIKTGRYRTLPQVNRPAASKDAELLPRDIKNPSIKATRNRTLPYADRFAAEMDAPLRSKDIKVPEDKI